MKAVKYKRFATKRRAHRSRARIRGTAERPRLSVYRSLKHIYAQLIDDDAGKTIAAASDRDLKASGKSVDIAREVGKALANKAKDAKVTRAVFDRGPYRYHGRVAAVAEGAREEGLEF